MIGIHGKICATREEWLQERKHSIGSSDAAAIVGASPWKTPLDVYIDKTSAEVATEETEEMHWGHLLEDPIADEFARRTQLRVVKPYGLERTLFRKESAPHAHASPDRFLKASNAEGAQVDGVLEIKTTNAMRASEWEEGVPLHYQVQVQHQLLVLELPMAFVTVLVGGQRMHSHEVQADRLFQEALEAQEVEFWRRVTKREPPEVAPGRDFDAVRRLFSKYTAGRRVLVLDETLGAWEEARALRLAAEKQEKEAATRLMSEIGDGEIGETPSGRRVKWALEIRNMPAQEARSIETRVLRQLKGGP